MSEWKLCLLESQAALITKGTTPTSLGKDFQENGINFIKAESITDAGTFVEEMFAFIDEETHEILKRSQLQNGDILFSIAGVIGRIAIVNQSILPANTNQAIALIRLSSNAEIEREFLKYFLNSEFIKNQIRRINVQAAQANFSLGDINRLFIRFPKNKKIQLKVAQILSSADAVIEKTQAAIGKCKAIRQGMLHDLFTRGIYVATGKLRPKYEDAPNLYKESKLGMIPIAWEESRIKDCIDPIMSNVDKHIKEDESRILLCNYMDVYSNRYLTNEIPYSDGSANKLEIQKFSLQPHDVIITKDSETPDDIAVPAVLTEKIENLICGYHLCILRSKNLNKVNGEFLMLQLQLQEINKQFAIKANGSTRYGLTLDAIENVYLKIPNDIKEQNEIVKRLKTADNKLLDEQTYLLKLQQIKAGLMSDLLSGKKRVKLPEEALAV